MDEKNLYTTACFTLVGSSEGNLIQIDPHFGFYLNKITSLRSHYCRGFNLMFLLYLCMYFTQRPIFEDSVSGAGNLLSYYYLRFM